MNLKDLPETLTVTVTQDDINADTLPPHRRYEAPWLGPLTVAVRRALSQAGVRCSVFDLTIAPGVGVKVWERHESIEIYHCGPMTMWLRKYHGGKDVGPATFVLKRVKA